MPTHDAHSPEHAARAANRVQRAMANRPIEWTPSDYARHPITPFLTQRGVTDHDHLELILPKIPSTLTGHERNHFQALIAGTPHLENFGTLTRGKKRAALIELARELATDLYIFRSRANDEWKE